MRKKKQSEFTAEEIKTIEVEVCPTELEEIVEDFVFINGKYYYTNDIHTDYSCQKLEIDCYVEEGE